VSVYGSPAPRLTVKPEVHTWTGNEVKQLRAALRLSVRDFANFIGVSDRLVSRWEARGGTANLSPRSTAALDYALSHSSTVVRERFATWPTGTWRIPEDAQPWVLYLRLDTLNRTDSTRVARQILAILGTRYTSEAMVAPATDPLNGFRVGT
jgi:transcriptional regulator with XRE-family HTH domain